MNNKIIISAGTRFLADVMKNLPSNCLFDKGKVGCEGTTIAINDENPTVIAVPFISLIESKVSQHSNLLGVMGGVSNADIEKYLSSTNIPKIMVTYDSLPKVMDAINPKYFNLLVDEYHLLFTQYSFRGDSAIKKLLTNYKDFKKYCFMTATELERYFILEELADLPIVSAVWEEVREVTVHSIKCNNGIKSTVINRINEFLAGTVEGNGYFFVNSVEFIKEMVKACNLTDENARAIWGKSNNKKVGLIKSNATSEAKKINFLTSTCFEGCDFRDENARIHIISDGSKAHTLLDISTSLQQIAGRVRDTKYWHAINHVFTTTRYNKNLSYEEYKTFINESIKEDKEQVEKLNGLSDKWKKNVITNENYISLVDGEFVFDANKVKVDLYNFKQTNFIYKTRVNVSNALIAKGFKVVERTSNIKSDVINMDKADSSFEEVVKSLKAAETSEEYDLLEVFMLDTELHKAAFAKYDFLERILRDKELSFKFIENYKYIQTNIKNKLLALSDKPQQIKVLKMLSSSDKIKIGASISSEDAKKLIAKIYSDLGIKITPKASELNKYFETKQKTGMVREYYIIRAKSFFSNEAGEGN